MADRLGLVVAWTSYILISYFISLGSMSRAIRAATNGAAQGRWSAAKCRLHQFSSYIFVGLQEFASPREDAYRANTVFCLIGWVLDVWVYVQGWLAWR